MGRYKMSSKGEKRSLKGGDVMPKVTYGKDVLLEKNKNQAARVIKYCKDKKGLSVEELGIKLGMSRSTVNKRIQDASNMTLKELCALYKLIGIEFKLPQVIIGGD